MTRHRDLVMAVEQASATLNRHRARLARLVRYHDECPDGDPRKAEVERDIAAAFRQVHAAEDAAALAVDELLDFEDAHPEEVQS